MTNPPSLFKRTGSKDFPRHLKVLVSGPPKSGKTSLLGTIPNMLVLDTEPHANNLQSIAHLDVPYVTITNTDDLRQVLFMLSDETLRGQIAQNYGLKEIGGVAIDTLDTLQKMMKVERLKEQRRTQFQRDDWGWLKTEMEELIQSFTALPMHVVFTVHTKTKEMGAGDEAYTVTLPGLEGAIAESIAGMVGYSLLSLRKEEIDTATGQVFTKYWLRTEGDATHDFIGTRVNGANRLPVLIEPNMGSIYQAVMSSRPAPKANEDQPIETPTATADPAQSSGTPEVPAEQVQTPVETEQAPAAPAETPAQEQRPPDDEPINAAALGHVKKVYDAIKQEFPEETIKKLTIGQAREIVLFWKAILADHNEGKTPEGQTPGTLMAGHLAAHGWLTDAPTEAAPTQEAKHFEAKPDGTIGEIKAYIGNPPDLQRVQEVYDLEYAKGGDARTTVLSKMEQLGAQTTFPSAVQTPVETTGTPAETPSEAVSPETPAADATPTEEEALATVQEGLGAEVIETTTNADAPCEECGNPIDDVDLADLGKRQFDRLLCVKDYLAEKRKRQQ